MDAQASGTPTPLAPHAWPSHRSGKDEPSSRHSDKHRSHDGDTQVSDVSPRVRTRFIRLSIQLLLARGHTTQRGIYEHALQSSGAHAVPLLAQALEDANAQGIVSILKLLERLGPKAAPALDKIRALTEHRDQGVRAAAQRALKRIPVPQAD